jgi:hypothetical protein
MAQGEQAAAGGLLPLLMQAILERSQSGIADPAATALAVAAALADRSLQVWIDNAVAAPALATAGWDGGLRPSAGADFLAVVDANLGQNKADALVERSHAYQVTWPDGPGKPALATLTLAYRHRGTAGSDPDCVPTPRAAKPYADLADRCYFNAVRVLAPAGSRLIDVEGVSVLAVTAGEGEEGTAEFATYFALPPGQEQRLVFTYRLPAELQPENYRLVVQRQAGTPPLPLRVRVDGEEAGTDVAGNTVVYTSDAAWVPAHD